MIFTDRTIMVKNGTSSINDTIVLYRGDRDVEIRFTLNEGTPFKFGSGASPNIIEKTEATYGQLVIKTPGALPPIFSEVTPTIGGKIIFTITAEMIDETTEVGNYTFQIRLLDDNMESRATLPEVKNGIEIREPIALEDISTTNEVGVAAVGYALTTAGTQEDTFDSQGNYNKTTWGTGDRITAVKLNKIEAGIDGVNQKIASGGTGGGVDLSGYVTKGVGNANQIQFADGQTFQAKLDAGILKGEKGDKGDKGDPGGPGASSIDDTTASATTTYSGNKIENIKEELSSQIGGKVTKGEGGVITNAMLSQNAILNDNIVDGQITTRKLNGKPINNLFDKAQVIYGGYYNFSDGTFVENSNPDTINCYVKIPILGDKTYYLSTASSCVNSCIFDNDNTFIVGHGASDKSFTTPTNAAYIIISMKNTCVDYVVFSDSPIVYEDYGYVMEGLVADKYLKNSIISENIKGNHRVGINLFNKYAIYTNTGYYNAGTEGYIPLTNADYNCISHKIYIDPTKKYLSRNKPSRLIFFDEEGNILSTYTGTLQNCDIPENSAFCQLCFSSEYIDTMQLEYGQTCTEYEEYRFSIDGLVANNVVNIKNSSAVDMWDLRKAPYTYDDYFNSVTTSARIIKNENNRTITHVLINGKESITNKFYKVSYGNMIQVDVKAICNNFTACNQGIRLSYYDKDGNKVSITDAENRDCMFTDLNHPKQYKFRFPIPKGTDYVEMSIYSKSCELTLYDINISLVSVDVFQNMSGIVFVGHQGLPIFAPQNTMPSFELAALSGMSAVVINTNITQDGVLVALHNDTINSTARNLDGTRLTETINIRDITYEQSKQYDFGIYQHSVYAGTYLPTIDEVLRLCAISGMHPVLRVSDTFTTDELSKLYNLVKKYKLQGNCTAKAFELNTLTNLHNIAGNNLRYGYCTFTYDSSLINQLKAFGDNSFIDLEYSAITPEIVNECKSQNINVTAWTISNFAKIYELIQMGVTEFTTDNKCLNGCIF